jgi:YbbR domain-containing protein
MAFRDYIVHNFGWKLLSLLLAALTWLVIETDTRKEQKLHDSPVVTGAPSRTFSGVPVTVLSPAASTGRFSVAPETVMVTIFGKQEDLERLQLQDIRVFVDVTGTGDEIKFQKKIQVQAPKDFKATANPENVSVERSSNIN